jgi:cell division protein FtsZ
MSCEETFKVVGVGGSGCAAAEKMAGCQGCDLIAVNTDAKTLLECRVQHKVLIGLAITKGRSTGNNIRLGEEAAVLDRDKIRAALDGARVTFIVAGLGGGTGAGAAPVVAEAAKSMGSVVVAFVNTPFGAEGKICRGNAQAGLEHLRPYCDLVVVIQNDRFLKVVSDMSIRDAFTKVNRMVLEAVKGMVKLTADAGVDNLKPILKGYATLGYGVGPTLAKAVDAALDSPLIGADLKEASGAMLEFTSHSKEVKGLQEALDAVNSKSPNAAIVWTNTVEDGAEAVEVLAIFSGYSSGF